MRNVAVIGMGHVGATVAFTLFTHGIVDNLYLLDKNQAKAEAEYNDLRDTLARNDYHVNVFLGDYSDLKDVDIIVTSFGNIKLRQLKLEIDLVNLKLILRMLRK